MRTRLWWPGWGGESSQAPAPGPADQPGAGGPGAGATSRPRRSATATPPPSTPGIPLLRGPGVPLLRGPGVPLLRGPGVPLLRGLGIPLFRGLGVTPLLPGPEVCSAIVLCCQHNTIPFSALQGLRFPRCKLLVTGPVSSPAPLPLWSPGRSAYVWRTWVLLKWSIGDHRGAYELAQRGPAAGPLQPRHALLLRQLPAGHGVLHQSGALRHGTASYCRPRHCVTYSRAFY